MNGASDGYAVRAAIDNLIMNVLIIPDKFKGTLSAPAAAAAMGRGWRRGRPGDRLDLLPMSDGGDGFGQVISVLLGASVQRIDTMDAAHRPCRGRWWWEAKTRTAVLESAAITGLAMLPPRRFHPFELDTFGLGKVIRAAVSKGARRLVIGVGGSATNDAGFGFARALGWEFLDRCGEPITAWTRLGGLARVVQPQPCLSGAQAVVAVDVQNPLLGPRGATRVYGPQKGLAGGHFKIAERCLGRLARVAASHFGKDIARVPGSGAAGGLGFGLQAFLGATLEPGFEFFARQARLGRRLQQADLVITGEGAIDRSTLMGKGVGQVAERCRELNLPCIGLAGTLAAGAEIARGFAQARALVELASINEARANPARWLERLAAAVSRSWDSTLLRARAMPARR